MIAGGGQHSFHHPMEQHVFFKEVDVIGNPAIADTADHTGVIAVGGCTLATLFSIHAGQRVVARISAVSDTGTSDGLWGRYHAYHW